MLAIFMVIFRTEIAIIRADRGEYFEESEKTFIDHMGEIQLQLHPAEGCSKGHDERPGVAKCLAQGHIDL